MIKKIDLKQAIVILILLLFLISPGLFILFLYQRSIFLEIDALKLLLLSLSIVTPFFLANLVPTLIFIDTIRPKEDSDNRSVFAVTLSVVATSTCIYVSTFFVSLFEANGTFKEAYRNAVFSEIAFVICTILCILYVKIKKRKKQ